MILIAVILLMGLIASAASFFLKKSTASGLSIVDLIRSPYAYLGGGLYVLSALLNLYLLKRLPYSIVVPLGSLTYIWTMGISYRLLGEAITREKMIGVLLVIAGVGIMAKF